MITYKDYEEIRNSKGLKDADVAKIANIPKSSFTAWKNGTSQPKQEKLSRIFAALDVYEEGLANMEKLKQYNNFVQTWTCEDNKQAKIIIPETATEDDLMAIKEMLDIIIKMKIKKIKKEK